MKLSISIDRVTEIRLSRRFLGLAGYEIWKICYSVARGAVGEKKTRFVIAYVFWHLIQCSTSIIFLEKNLGNKR